jgi:hypothetical protein
LPYYTNKGSAPDNQETLPYYFYIVFLSNP